MKLHTLSLHIYHLGTYIDVHTEAYIDIHTYVHAYIHAYINIRTSTHACINIRTWIRFRCTEGRVSLRCPVRQQAGAKDLFTLQVRRACSAILHIKHMKRHKFVWLYGQSVSSSSSLVRGSCYVFVASSVQEDGSALSLSPVRVSHSGEDRPDTKTKQEM